MQKNTMIRKEDEEAIRTTIKILSTVCSNHERCADCRLLVSDNNVYYGCALAKPPICYDADEIINCFT